MQIEESLPKAESSSSPAPKTDKPEPVPVFDRAEAERHNARYRCRQQHKCQCRQYNKAIRVALQDQVTPFRLMLMWLGGLDVSDGQYPFVVNPKTE